jgi:hypothetical protein
MSSNRNTDLLYKFGISLKAYNLIFDLQRGCCLGCGTHQSQLERSLAVDHDHKTNKVRGLLCTRCNLILGHVDDSIEILHRLAIYLKRFAVCLPPNK